MWVAVVDGGGIAAAIVGGGGGDSDLVLLWLFPFRFMQFGLRLVGDYALDIKFCIIKKILFLWLCVTPLT